MTRLFLFVVVFAITSWDIQSMENFQPDFERKKIAATLQAIDDAKVKAIADQFVRESSINGNSPKSVIIDAINETNNLSFWRKHGRLGDFRVYSKRLAELILDLICNKKDMYDFIVVVNGIISGRVSSTEKVSYDNLVKSGINKSLLSKIDLWQ